MVYTEDGQCPHWLIPRVYFYDTFSESDHNISVLCIEKCDASLWDVRKVCLHDVNNFEDFMRYVEFITSAWSLLSRVATETLLYTCDWHGGNLMLTLNATAPEVKLGYWVGIKHAPNMRNISV